MSKKAPTTEENSGEMFFTWWLDELKHNGYIKRYDREPEFLQVLPPFVHQREKHYKTKPNEFEDFNMIPPINYTYDFRILWEEKAKYIFTEPFAKGEAFRFGMPDFVSHYIKLDGYTELTSFVDVKPHAASARFNTSMSSLYTFPLIQKFLLHRRGIYINKIIPNNSGKNGVNTCLFAQTFTPNRYLFTDTGQQLRKIPFKKTTITSYTERRASIIESLFEDIKKKETKESQIKLL